MRELLYKKVSEIKTDNVLLDVYPRVGKSGMVTTLLKKWNSQKILILTNSIITNTNWIDLLKEYNPELIPLIDISCYQSIHKCEDIYDTIVLDELELAFTDKRLSNLMGMTPKHWIGASGTLDDSDIELFKTLVGEFNHFKVGLEEAISLGILPTPKIIKVEIELSNDEVFYQKGNDKKKKTITIDFADRYNHYQSNQNLLIRCTEKEYYQLLCADIEFLKTRYFQTYLEMDKVRWLYKANLRKQWLGNLKTKYLKKILTRCPGQTLIFSTDIKQANEIAAWYQIEPIHSKVKNQNQIKDFNQQKINKLINVKMLDRGVDINNVDYLVLIQLENSQKGITQRIARSLLSQNPKIILPVISNTRDEEYFDVYKQGIKESWIQAIKL